VSHTESNTSDSLEACTGVEERLYSFPVGQQDITDSAAFSDFLPHVAPIDEGEGFLFRLRRNETVERRNSGRK